MDTNTSENCTFCYTALFGAAVILAFVLWNYFCGKSGVVGAQGKAVFITGCDSGFGLLLAKKLQSLGYFVIAGYLCETSDGCRELAKLTNVETVKCDVTSDEDVDDARQVVEKTIKYSGLVLWAIVNNAGCGEANYLEWQSVKYFDQIYQVNALGQVRVLKALLPFVRKSHGRVVNVASLAGRISIAGGSAYCMSKHAVVALSDALRQELAPFGVKVSIIQPGAYNTNITDLQRIRHATEQQWNETDESVRQDYGRRFFDAVHTKRRESFTIRENIYEVIDSMVHAVTSQHPKTAYDCHWSTTVLRVVIAHILPDRVNDWIARRTRQPTQLPASCQ